MFQDNIKMYILIYQVELYKYYKEWSIKSVKKEPDLINIINKS
jgi:hypothetical protein